MSLFAACGYSQVQGSPVKDSPARILPLPYLPLDEAGDGVRQPAYGGQSLQGCAVDTPGVRRFPVAAGEQAHGRDAVEPDRKSTRVNSSHRD